MAIVLIHNELVQASQEFKAECEGHFDSILSPDEDGNPPIPFLQGYPTVMIDVPPYRVQDQEIEGINPDGSRYACNIPAQDLPATKEAIFSPAAWDAVQARIEEVSQRAIDNPPQDQEMNMKTI